MKTYVSPSRTSKRKHSDEASSQDQTIDHQNSISGDRRLEITDGEQLEATVASSFRPFSSSNSPTTTSKESEKTQPTPAKKVHQQNRSTRQRKAENIQTVTSLGKKDTETCTRRMSTYQAEYSNQKPSKDDNHTMLISQFNQSYSPIGKTSDIQSKLQMMSKILGECSSSLGIQMEDMERNMKEAEMKQQYMLSQYEEISREKENIREELKQARIEVSNLEEMKKSLQVEKENIMMDTNSTIERLKTEASQLHDELKEIKKERIISKLKNNILVFGRVRPLVRNVLTPHINFPDTDDRVIELEKVNPVPPNENMASVTNVGNGGKQEFCLDRVFKPSSTQEDVFKQISPLLLNAFEGRNVSIIAYGETGSGKTYSMRGSGEKTNRGIIPRAVEQIFAVIEDLKDKGWNHKVEVSSLEIINETIHDLLNSTAMEHEIESVGQDEINITNLINSPMVDTTEVHKFLRLGTKSRSAPNAGHHIFKMTIKGRNNITMESKSAHVHFVELAGSEILNGHDSRGTKTREGHSLSNLKNIIISLANMETRVYFTNSKLARILQSSITGHSQVLIFIHVNPQKESIKETFNSLTFALEIRCQGILMSREDIELKLTQMKKEERRHAIKSLSTSLAETTIKFIETLECDMEESKLFSEALSTWRIESPHIETFFFLDLEFTATDGGFRIVEFNIVVVSFDNFMKAQQAHLKTSDPDKISVRIANKISLILNPLIDFRSSHSKLDSEKVKSEKVLDENTVSLLGHFFSEFRNVCIVCHGCEDVKNLLGEVLSLRKSITQFLDIHFIDSDKMFRALHPERDSFKLQSIFSTFFSKNPSKQHQAEFDAFTLLLCCIREQGFKDYIQKRTGSVREVTPSILKGRTNL